MSISCDDYSAYLFERGGTQVVAELPFSGLSFGSRLDDSSEASVTIPADCCESVVDAEPWKHEVVIFENSDVAFVGPLINMQISQQGVQLSARDLYFWMQYRFIEQDLFFSGDASLGFKMVFEKAMEVDTSPNIGISVHDSGVETLLEIHGKEFQRAADILSTLTRTALDFVVLGRIILVGGSELFQVGEGKGTPLILHDDGVLSMEVTKDGTQFATDVAVFGEAVSQGSDNRVYGREERSSSVYGVVQASYAELGIKDTPMANANALARLDQMQPAPIQVSATLGPDAAFERRDLIPGRRLDMRIAQAAGCIQIFDTMRLNSVAVEVTRGDGQVAQVSVDIIPVGVDESAS